MYNRTTKPCSCARTPPTSGHGRLTSVSKSVAAHRFQLCTVMALCMGWFMSKVTVMMWISTSRRCRARQETQSRKGKGYSDDVGQHLQALQGQRGTE